MDVVYLAILYVILLRMIIRYTAIYKVTDQSARRGTILAAEVNHAPGSYVYTMGVLYGEISTWPTKQLVDLSRRYVSNKRVRRLLTEQLVEVTLF